MAQLKGVYALTTTAVPFLRGLGFVETDRTTVPPEMAASREFLETCPSTAACLVFSLE
jgi:N-acetylglutamate synthase-like GNAT family acetyltransferase